MRSSIRAACESESGAVDQGAEVIDTLHTVATWSCEEREEPPAIAADEEGKNSGHDSADKETIPREEPPTVSGVGKGWLQNDVKRVGQKFRRRRMIATFVLAFLFGGGALSYFLVPSVRSRVSALLANVPGTDSPAAVRRTDTQAGVETGSKARVMAYRNEANRNIVYSSGVVENISNEPLENLEVEVSLVRYGDAPPEIRKVSIIPNPVPPSQTGTFKFEYDGQRKTGFEGYRITRLLSNGIEIEWHRP